MLGALQILILLSALLASLTGLVSGERPAERAQVELSAVAAAIQPGRSVAQASLRPAAQQPRLRTPCPEARKPSARAPRTEGVRWRLRMKRAWLE